MAGLLAVLCLCSILLGRVQGRENPLLRFGMTPCDATFCLGSIRAGLTEWGDAKALLGVRNDTARFEREAYQVAYWRDAEDKAQFEIHAVAGSIGAPPLTLGELVVEFGEPCSLTLASDRAYIQFAGFVAETPVPRDVDRMRQTLLTPRSPMTALIFPQGIACDTPMTFVSSRNIYVRWCGFTTLGSYIDRCRLPGLILLPD